MKDSIIRRCMEIDAELAKNPVARGTDACEVSVKEYKQFTKTLSEEDPSEEDFETALNFIDSIKYRPNVYSS